MPMVAAVSGGSPASGPAVATAAAPASPQAIAAAIRAAAAAPSGPPPKAVVTLDGPSQVKVGEEFNVTVHLGTDKAISHLHGQVRFDPTAVQLVSATAGDAVPASAGSPKVDARSGGAQIDVTASEDPISGEGTLMVLRFKALAPRDRQRHRGAGFGAGRRRAAVG